MKKKHAEHELIAGDERVLIPEGKYSAQCIKAKREMVGVATTMGTYARTPKIILTFQIIDGPYQGQEVPMYLNVNFRRIPCGSKFFQCWVIANDGKKPNRRDRMPLERFLNHIFLVGVKTVKPKFADGTEKPEALWYSRIDEIYDKLA